MYSAPDSAAGHCIQQTELLPTGRLLHAVLLQLARSCPPLVKHLQSIESFANKDNTVTIPKLTLPSREALTACCRALSICADTKSATLLALSFRLGRRFIFNFWMNQLYRTDFLNSTYFTKIDMHNLQIPLVSSAE